MFDTEVVGWVQLVLAVFFSFYLVNKSIPVLIRLAYKLDIYDKPDGERKVHTKYISNLGGIAIFIAFITGFLFSGIAHELLGLSYFIGAMLALFFCGLKDDLIGLSPRIKLLIQVFAAAAVIFGMGLSVDNFGGVFSINEIPIFISIPVTLFTIIVVINAFNLIDGIDGLAGGIAATASIIFSLGFFIADEYLFAVMALTLAVVCIGYLFHNFHPASIFMGDTGSLVIGFLLSTFAIKFIQLSGNQSYSDVLGNTSAIIPIAVLSVPLYDTLRVFGRRISRGQSPFSADSDHIHHTLLKIGWGQKRTVLYLYTATILICIVAIATSTLNINLSLFAIISSMLLLLPTTGVKRRLANRIGIDIERLSRPKTSVDQYLHLDFENKKRTYSPNKEEEEPIA